MISGLNDFMHDCRQRVDFFLDKLLPISVDDTSALRQAMRYSLFSGGKRVRPILVYASAAAVGHDIIDVLVGDKLGGSDIFSDLDRVACALECIHAYSLVHDDLPAMDNDDLRRGKATCHIAFNEATAILAGDALQSLAFEQLACLAQVSAQTSVTLIKHLANAVGARGMVAGQAIDLNAVNQRLTLTALEEMHNCKTGALIRASVMMGALAQGDVGVEQLEALDRYARAVGLAFQVRDDILDVMMDTHILGKRQGADKALNKPTYVSLLGMDAARQKALDLHSDALASISELGDSANRLRDLSSYIVERSH